MLHAREFLQRGPWAVSSNSQWAVLAHPLVTRSRPQLTCTPREGVFAERSLGSQLKFSADSARHPLVTHSRPRLACAPHKGGYEKGVGSASPGFAHILHRTASLIPMSCHMREINLTNHSLSSHSPPNQTPCSPSNFFPQKLFKKVCFTSLTFPAQSIEQWCHCYFSVHNSTCPSHPYPQKKKFKLIKKNNFKKK